MSNVKPKILLLSLDKQPFFDEMYTDLLHTLRSDFTLIEARRPASAFEHIKNTLFSAVLITDNGFAGSKCSKQLRSEVVRYIQNGGAVIICCHFSSFTSMDEYDFIFRDVFKLDWRHGDYTRSDYDFNRNCLLGKGDTQILRNVEKRYSMKALHLKVVDKNDMVYIPFDQSHVPDDNTPVAMKKIGNGFIGYVGDVNTEDGSTRVLAEMCKFALKQSSSSSTSSDSKATSAPSGIKPANSTSSSSVREHTDPNPESKTVGKPNVSVSSSLPSASLKKSLPSLKPSTIVVLSLTANSYQQIHPMEHLEILYDVQIITSPPALIDYLSNYIPTAVLIVDKSFSTPENSVVFPSLKSYLTSGGVIILCGSFPLCPHESDLHLVNKILYNFDLPWSVAQTATPDTYTKFSKNVHIKPSTQPYEMMAQEVNISACILWKVALNDKLYSVREAEDPSDTPIALGKVGEGYLGFIGDYYPTKGGSGSILAGLCCFANHWENHWVCAKCGISKREKTLERCTGCQKVWYCSRNCQRKDWEEKHREECKRLDKRQNR